VEGIFRINGGEREVAAICEEFERSPLGVHDFSAMNIHTLPSVIKKYLGSLPEPVIPSQFSAVFMEVVGEFPEPGQFIAIFTTNNFLQTLTRPTSPRLRH
jgi:hypothetical protein